MRIIVLFLIFVGGLLPLVAEPAPVDEPTLSVYSSSIEQNTRKAVRLGYQNFLSRIHTPDKSITDMQIALVITTGLNPWLEKVNKLENTATQQDAAQMNMLREQFEKLIAQLAALFIKNQTRYTNPLFLEDKYAVQETTQIVYDAVNRGYF